MIIGYRNNLRNAFFKEKLIKILFYTSKFSLSIKLLFIWPLGSNDPKSWKMYKACDVSYIVVLHLYLQNYNKHLTLIRPVSYTHLDVYKRQV